jgi:hypothetical protein
MRWTLPLLFVALMSLAGCGDDSDGDSENDTDATSTADPCPGSPGQYTGPTSEDLCVTIERDESGAITLLEIEVMASCSVGFGESEIEISSAIGTETLTSTEAPPNPNETFEATMSFGTPMTVGTDGAFEAPDSVAGTISDSEAQGSYEPFLAGFVQVPTGVNALTCTGAPVTFTASPVG